MPLCFFIQDLNSVTFNSESYEGPGECVGNKRQYVSRRHVQIKKELVASQSSYLNMPAPPLGPLIKRNIDQAEPCFITKHRSYTLGKAHWVNAVRGKPDLKARANRVRSEYPSSSCYSSLFDAAGRYTVYTSPVSVVCRFS